MVHTTSKKRWSKLEDSYIILSLQKGLSTSEIAKTIDRSNAAVSNRKWTLGLEGRFKNSKKGTAKPSSKRIASVSDQESVETFKLENNIPLPQRIDKNLREKTQLRIIFEQMKPGQSFVVPKGSLYFARAIYKSEFESYRIKISPTPTNGKFYRIFRVA